MHIWILAKEHKFENYENLRFQEAAREMGVELTMVAPEHCEIISTKEGRKSIYLNGEEIDRLPDCLIPRTGSGTTYFASAVIRHLEHLGVFVLNTDKSIELAKDKLATVQTLSMNNIPIPNTILAKFPLDLDLIEKQFSFPVILKKVSGSEGKGIVLCENKSQLQDIAELVKSSSNVIIQECITESLGKDIRVFVVGGRVIGTILRTACDGTFKANYSAGGTVSEFTTTPEIEWLAVESARLMGLEIAGVDLLFDQEGYRICEVNSAPYFAGFEEATGINVAQEIFKFIQIRLDTTPKQSEPKIEQSIPLVPSTGHHRLSYQSS